MLIFGIGKFRETKQKAIVNGTATSPKSERSKENETVNNATIGLNNETLSESFEYRNGYSYQQSKDYLDEVDVEVVDDNIFLSPTPPLSRYRPSRSRR